MSFELKDKSEYLDENVYDFMKFMHDNIDTDYEIAKGSTVVKASCPTDLFSLFDANQIIDLEDDNLFYCQMVYEDDNLLTLGYPKDYEYRSTLPITFSLEKKVDLNQFQLTADPEVVAAMGIDMSKYTYKNMLKPVTLEQLIEKSQKEQKSLGKKR